MKLRLSLILAVMLGASAAWAQVPAGPGPDGPGPGGPGRKGRDEALKMIDAYIISNLQESLDLSDTQFAQLIPLVKKLQSDRQGFAGRRMEATQELRRTLKSGGVSETRVGELLKTLKAIEADEPGALRRDLDAIDAALTPLQQAKFRILQVEVEFKIRELMGQLRGPGPGAGRGQGRNRPDGRRQPDGLPNPQ